MIDPASARAALPWSGGRPWEGAEDDNPEPDQRLRGTGRDLAAALALVTEGSSPADEPADQRRARLVDVVVAAERVKAWAAGVQARAVADLHAEFRAEHGAVEPSLNQRLRDFEAAGRATTLCLSLAVGISLRAADRTLALALGLRELPSLSAALAEGRIDEAQARTLQDQASALPPALRARLVDGFVGDVAADSDENDDALIPELRDGTRTVWSLPPHQLRPLLHRRVAELAPEALESAERAAVRRRRVEHHASTPLQPGALLLHGPDHLLAAAYQRLDAGARSARRAGAGESLDQLRFDAAIEALTGGAVQAAGTPGAGTAGAAIGVDVVVDATTLLGLDEKLGTMRTPSGDVPISPGLARRLAHDETALWRRVLCDPTTGVALDVSGRYQPPPRMAAFCAVRDGHMSRFPTSSARRLELDHVAAYDHEDPAAGGPTTPANLASTGKRDHQAKTDRLLTVSGDANGTLTYRTGAGHTYRSPPYRYLDGWIPTNKRARSQARRSKTLQPGPRTVPLPKPADVPR
jgi:hypothetical protein